MWIAIAALLCITVMAQLSFGLLPAMTPARWFYVLRGMEGAILFLLLPLMAQRTPTSRQLAALVTVAMFGATMEALTAICGLAWYWGKGPIPQPSGGLLCDAAHPQTWAWLTIAVAAALILIVRARRDPA